MKEHNKNEVGKHEWVHQKILKMERETHTHNLTSSLSLGIPVPRPTQCLRDV